MAEFKNLQPNNKPVLSLMTWEVNPNKRQKNGNEIGFVLKEGESIDVGDEITHYLEGKEETSVWTIEDVKEVNPAKLRGYNYFKATASWRYRR